MDCQAAALACPAILLEKLRFGFAGGHGRAPFAVEVDRLEVPSGGCLVLRGDSGSGKSTLLSLLSLNRTVDRQTASRFLYRGKDVTGLDDVLLSALRAWSIGFIFQDPALFEEWTGLANVEAPLRRLFPRWAPERRRRLAWDALGMFFERVEQRERVAHGVVARLSGGERQRVMLARSIVHRPALLFADEPTTGLDLANVRVLLEMLVALQALGTTIVLVSHDGEFLRDLADAQAARGLEGHTVWLVPDAPARPHVRCLRAGPPDHATGGFRLAAAWTPEGRPCLRCGGLPLATADEGCSCAVPTGPAERGCPACGRAGGGDYCGGCRLPLFPIYGAAGTA